MNLVLVDISPAKNFLTMGYHPHVGFAYIAACLEQKGHAVRIIDSISSNNNIRQMIKQIVEFKPAIVGFTSRNAARFKTITVITARSSPGFSPRSIHKLGFLSSQDILSSIRIGIRVFTMR